VLRTREDAYRLLADIGAPGRLLLHLRLVGEAADELVEAYRALDLVFDAELIELGVAVHDAGKIQHPQELLGPGSLHERAGERLMLDHGVQAEVARCCITHAAWQGEGVSFEERSVALADKLWKGKRQEDLELLVLDEVATRLGKARWEVFQQLDSAFEAIASRADGRLARSKCATGAI